MYFHTIFFMAGWQKKKIAESFLLDRNLSWLIISLNSTTTFYAPVLEIKFKTEIESEARFYAATIKL